MLKTIAISVVAAFIALGVPSYAAAAPVSNALAIKNAVPSNVETVQWRRGYWRGGYGWRGYGWRGGGWGYYGGGFAAGALLGGLLAAPYYAGPRYYYGPGYGPGYYGDAVDYCMRRFRSYDPYSGTYLGYDGYRHPCP